MTPRIPESVSHSEPKSQLESHSRTSQESGGHRPPHRHRQLTDDSPGARGGRGEEARARTLEGGRTTGEAEATARRDRSPTIDCCSRPWRDATIGGGERACGVVGRIKTGVTGDERVEAATPGWRGATVAWGIPGDLAPPRRWKTSDWGIFGRGVRTDRKSRAFLFFSVMGDKDSGNLLGPWAVGRGCAWTLDGGPAIHHHRRLIFFPAYQGEIRTKARDHKDWIVTVTRGSHLKRRGRDPNPIEFSCATNLLGPKKEDKKAQVAY